MTTLVQHSEKIFWIWSDRREREISVRIRYSVCEDDGCKLISLNGREEW
jgi:hypothetical protein